MTMHEDDTDGGRLTRSATHPDMAPSQRGLAAAVGRMSEAHVKFGKRYGRARTIPNDVLRVHVEDLLLDARRVVQHSTRVLELMEADRRASPTLRGL